MSKDYEFLAETSESFIYAATKPIDLETIGKGH
jgi:hypothetical protein